MRPRVRPLGLALGAGRPQRSAGRSVTSAGLQWIGGTDKLEWSRSALLGGRIESTWACRRLSARTPPLDTEAAARRANDDDGGDGDDGDDGEDGNADDDNSEAERVPLSEMTTRDVNRPFLSDLLQHYCSTKDSHRQALLLYRVGDFYEAYFEDARALAEAAGISLTGKRTQYYDRSKGRPGAKLEMRVPMSGLPAHACDKHVASLVKQGLSIAICDQVLTGETYPAVGRKLYSYESKDNAGNIFVRQVTRVITPGTLLEEELLRPSANNFLAALVLPPPDRPDAPGGLAYADVSTGETFGVEGTRSELLLELQRVAPVEVLCPANVPPDSRGGGYGVVLPGADSPLLDPGLPTGFLYIPRDPADFAAGPLAGRFASAAADGPAELAPFAAARPNAARALGAIVSYLDAVVMGGAEGAAGRPGTVGSAAGSSSAAVAGTRLALFEPRAYGLGECLQLDETARRNLDLFDPPGAKRASLLWALDRTRTAMGARLLRSWLSRPLRDVEEIGRRLDAVGELKGDPARRREVQRALNAVLDMPRTATRVRNAARPGGYAAARDLVALAASLRAVEDVVEALGPLAGGFGQRMRAALTDGLRAAAAEIERVVVAEPPPAVVANGPRTVRRGVSGELDGQRERLREAEDFLKDIAVREREQTGIGSVRLERAKDKCFLSLKRADERRVPRGYLYVGRTTDRLRYTTAELQRQFETVLSGGFRIAALEARELQALSAAAAALAAEVQRLSDAVAAVDVLASFAQAADDWGYTRPEVVDEPDGSGMVIVKGRHPVVEQRLDRGDFVANSVTLGGGPAALPAGDALHEALDGAHRPASPRLAVLTGPNASGKSCYLRMVGLLQVMAQVGSWLPASEGTRVPAADRLFTRVGALDELAEGLSTFTVEMRETAEILRHATPRSLVLVDEVGRGTSFQDGLAIAAVVAAHLAAATRCRTVFATHLHELAQLPSTLPPGAAACFQVLVRVPEREGAPAPDLLFLHEVRPGDAGQSYGVEVAELAGLPPPLVRQARSLRARLQGEPAVSPASLARLFLLALPGSPDGAAPPPAAVHDASAPPPAVAAVPPPASPSPEPVWAAAAPSDGAGELSRLRAEHAAEEEEEDEEAPPPAGARRGAGSSAARGAAFERAVLRTLRRYGLRLRLVGGSGDEGTDLEGEWRLPDGSRLPAMVQARYRARSRLGPDHVRELAGARGRGEGALRILVGRLGFSDEAHKAMREAGEPVLLWGLRVPRGALDDERGPPLETTSLFMNNAAKLRLPRLSVVSARGPALPGAADAGRPKRLVYAGEDLEEAARPDD